MINTKFIKMQNHYPCRLILHLLEWNPRSNDRELRNETDPNSPDIAVGNSNRSSIPSLIIGNIYSYTQQQANSNRSALCTRFPRREILSRQLYIRMCIDASRTWSSFFQARVRKNRHGWSRDPCNQSASRIEQRNRSWNRAIGSCVIALRAVCASKRGHQRRDERL